MRNASPHRALGVVSLIAIVAVLPVPARAQSGSPPAILVRPGSATVLDSAPCIRPLVPADGSLETARVSDAKTYAIYRAAPDQSSDVTVALETGPRAKADGSGCEPAAQRQYRLAVDRSPELSQRTLGEAFTVLLTAFVLALLLESAFALLFNWRLFQEFFVGRAWRTPIMFLGALLVVRLFGLDLMARLFDAYDPRVGNTSPSTWFTSVLTAMILAGGSVGVNRLLVSLGFRSQIRPDTTPPPLARNEAWIAVQVRDEVGGRNIQVAIDELPLPPGGTEPRTTVAIVNSDGVGHRLRSLLFPNRSRVPRSGGRTVDTDKLYTITVTDLSQPGGKTYDALGTEVTPANPPRAFRFGSRAIVDFEVAVK